MEAVGFDQRGAGTARIEFSHGALTAAADAHEDEDRAGWLAAMAQRLAEGKARGEAMVLTCSALKLAYRDRLRQGDPDLFFIFLDGSQELLQARMDARKGHFMPPGLLGSQLATLERPNLASEKCLHVSITLTPEQIGATVAVAMRRFA
jgi:carbohydrate kinase (thermoresistant glucokinase family)